MGLLLFLAIVGGLGALACFAATLKMESDASAFKPPVLVKVTALDNVYAPEAPKPKRSHHKKKPAPDPPFRSF